MIEQPSEAELHAFVDGQLPPGRQAEIEAWLATRPDIAEEVAEWRRQSEAIRAIFASEADGVRVPVRNVRPGALGRRKIAAVAVGLFFAGVAAGAAGLALLRPPPGAPEMAESLPQSSRTNFVVYTGEVRHPVEVGASEEAHLVGWLGKRLGSPLVAPDLQPLGFRLIGGRLVPFDAGPGALLMYEDPSGERLTLLAGRNSENGQTGFRFHEGGGVQTFYWIDGPLGYAISGKVARETLERVAREVYRQL